MKELRWETKAEVYKVDELPDGYKRLYDKAFEVARDAYAPYSGFHVGAVALLDDGSMVCGNNQENAAYPSGLCAERTTLFHAGACYPDVAVRVLAIAALNEGKRVRSITPCGACRQVMIETERRQGKAMRVLLCGEKEIYLIAKTSDLLPFSFDEKSLKE